MVLSATSIAASVSARAQAPGHHADRLPFSTGPVTNAATDATIRDAANRYRVLDPPRVAFYDVTLPADSAETVALHGDALLVVTAIARDSAELPLRRVYVHRDGEDYLLTRIAGVRSRLPASSPEAEVFGVFRVDELYLLPLTDDVSAGELLIDFAAHRSGFRLDVLGDEIPAKAHALAHIRVPSTPPPMMDIWRMLRREYPDLSAALVRQSLR